MRKDPQQRRLVVMVKEPVMGRVKTRLAREIGWVEATRFYRGTAHAVVARLSADTRWRTVLAVAPDTAVGSRVWLPHIDRRGQGDGDLARRMQRIMDWRGPGPIVIVGTDIPAIRPAHIAQAFRALGRTDAVLGPAGDGGYWLVGLARVPRVLAPFRSVRWSSAHALADTRRNLDGHDIAEVAQLDDVDDGAAFARVRGFCGRRVLPVAI